MHIKIYKKLKSEFIWIVFVCISLSSTVVLLNEYPKYDFSKSGNQSIEKTIKQEEALDDENFKSNDLLILKKLAGLLTLFIES